MVSTQRSAQFAIRARLFVCDLYRLLLLDVILGIERYARAKNINKNHYIDKN